MALEDFYEGDEHFCKYSLSFQNYWETFPFQVELLSLLEGNVVLARPISYHLGKNYLAWFDSAPGVLEGLSPRQCLNSDAGIKRLKMALLRFPC
ncbi:hypothetical protein AOR10_23230 [Vibrio alginolyticus]|nr:hypothetical protein AOR10_23230 [Vibrio alginolyticus]